MASTDQAKQALAKAQKGGPADTLAKLIDAMTPEIARVLPKQMNPDRMARIATTLMRRTPDLALVEPMSFLGALMTCSQLGLEPGPLGHAWIIPRKQMVDKKPTGVLEAHFQLGYKGVIELARRSGQLAKIIARTVYETEFTSGKFTVVYEGPDEIVRHEPILIGERGMPVLYYMAAKLTSGETVFTPLRPDEVEKRHRHRPQASPNSPAWTNDYESMAWKSCVVEGRRWLPQSVELEQAIAAEGRVRTDLAPDVLEMPPADYIDSTAVEEPPADAWPATAQPPPAEQPPADGGPAK
jgi:recombination protein RecT